MAVLSLKINLKIQIMKHNGIIITTLQDSNNTKNTKKKTQKTLKWEL